MHRLRQLHIVLGVTTIPFVLFMTGSGIWQLLNLHIQMNPDRGATFHPAYTLHTQKQLKTGTSWNSTAGKWILGVAALGVLLNAASGVAMAYRFMGRRVFFACLGAGAAGFIVLVVAGVGRWG